MHTIPLWLYLPQCTFLHCSLNQNYFTVIIYGLNPYVHMNHEDLCWDKPLWFKFRLLFLPQL